MPQPGLLDQFVGPPSRYDKQIFGGKKTGFTYGVPLTDSLENIFLVHLGTTNRFARKRFVSPFLGIPQTGLRANSLWVHYRGTTNGFVRQHFVGLLGYHERVCLNICCASILEVYF